ncbi:MAG: AAA family ATPase [Pseudomonadota bacterium]
MYNDFYGLKEKPFAAEPNPRFLVLMEEHQEALSTLVYAIDQQEGWALVVGEPGVGKTTLIIALLRELGERVLSAVVTNPKLVPLDFLNQLALELGLEGPFASKGPFLAALAQLINRCRREGKLILLVVDEAQDLSAEMLEELRLLGNLDNASPRVLNIFLVGQPEIIRVLKRAAARALMQRLHRSYALKPLTPKATALYVSQRLSLAGASGAIFNVEGLAGVYEVSRGVPRLINSVCDDALLLGMHQEQKTIGRELVRQAAADDPSLDWPPSEEFLRGVTPPPLPEPQPHDAAPEPPAERAPAPSTFRAAALAAELALDTQTDSGGQPQAPSPQRPEPGDETTIEPEDAPPPLPRPEPGMAPPRRPLPGAVRPGQARPLVRPPAKRRGIFSRLAAGLSREAPGSLWKRVLFLLLLLALLGGGYFGVKKAWPRIKFWVSGPTIEIPDIVPEVAKSAPKAKEGPIDWGPTLKVASPAITEKEGRRGQND